MTLDRKDYKSAIPQLEKRLSEVEKIGKDAFNKFEDIAHKTQLDAAEAEKKVAALDYQIDSINVVTEYQLQTNGQDPVEANWSTTMPSITYSSYNGKTLWARSVTYQNDIAVRKTAPQKVQLMDGLYTFVNSASGNTGWTMIDGDFIQTGKIASTNGYSYFDIDNNSFQMKDASTVALSNSVLAWQNGLLYVKGKIAVGSSSTDQKYYTEMTVGGFDIVADNVNLAHIGYDTGKTESGSTSTSKYPYYTFGIRASNTSSTRGNYSVAEGVNTTASGYASHAEGGYTTAGGMHAHTEGFQTTTNGVNAHAEGNWSKANGHASHAEGYYTTASGDYSHTEGYKTFARSDCAHSNGYEVRADGKYSSVCGKYNSEDASCFTRTTDTSVQTNKIYYYKYANNRYEVVANPINTELWMYYELTGDGEYAFIIGNGTSTVDRSNALTVDWDGNIKAGGLDCGKVSITPVADQVTSKAVTFSHTFSSAPNVVATAESAYPNAVSEVTVSNITTTGFTMNLLRTTNVATNIFWIAML